MFWNGHFSCETSVILSLFLSEISISSFVRCTTLIAVRDSNVLLCVLHTSAQANIAVDELSHSRWSRKLLELCVEFTSCKSSFAAVVFLSLCPSQIPPTCDSTRLQCLQFCVCWRETFIQSQQDKTNLAICKWLCKVNQRCLMEWESVKWYLPASSSSYVFVVFVHFDSQL